jgi:hypothetical protein
VVAGVSDTTGVGYSDCSRKTPDVNLPAMFHLVAGDNQLQRCYSVIIIPGYTVFTFFKEFHQEIYQFLLSFGQSGFSRPAAPLLQ